MSPSLCAIAVSDIPAVVFFLDHQNQCWSSCNIASDQSSSMLRCHRFAGWKKPTDVVRVRVRVGDSDVIIVRLRVWCVSLPMTSITNLFVCTGASFNGRSISITQSTNYCGKCIKYVVINALD